MYNILHDDREKFQIDEAVVIAFIVGGREGLPKNEVSVLDRKSKALCMIVTTSNRFSVVIRQRTNRWDNNKKGGKSQDQN